MLQPTKIGSDRESTIWKMVYLIDLIVVYI
jgi:hypothetical protein